MFSIIRPLFPQKTKPLYPHPKNLFGIGILIWAAKNQGFSLRVSVVRDVYYSPAYFQILTVDSYRLAFFYE